MRCAPLRADLELEQGATLLTNPLTAWVLATQARREGHRAVVLTAAAGALGQMLNRLFLLQRRSVVNVVRRREHVEILHRLGADHVLCSREPGFAGELRGLAARLGATLLLDAVAGATTGQVLAAMPDGSHARVYGMLANAPCQVDVSDLVFRGKKLDGFTMYEWTRRTSLFGQLVAVRKVQRLVKDVLATPVRARMPLDAHERAIAQTESGAAAGKVLFVP